MQNRAKHENVGIGCIHSYLIHLFLFWCGYRISIEVKAACLEDKMKHGSFQQLSNKALPFTTQVPQASQSNTTILKFACNCVIYIFLSTKI